MTDTSRIPAAAWWRVDLDADGRRSWTLSPEVYDLHGVPRDGDLRGVDVVLSGLHPGDLELPARAHAILSEGRRGFAHRRTLGHGELARQVLTVGTGEYAEDGTLTAINGAFVDLASAIDEQVTAQVTAQLQDIVEARGAIEQAKGVIALACGISPEEAFQLLGWYSQRTNTRVRTLADRIATGAQERPDGLTSLDVHIGRLLEPRSEALLPHLGAAPSPSGDAPRVESTRVGGHDVIRLTGDVDVVAAREVVPRVRDALAAVHRPSRPHVLDLSDAGYLSPAVLVALAGVVDKHLNQSAELAVLAGWTADALRAAGVPPERLAG